MTIVGFSLKAYRKNPKIDIVDVGEPMSTRSANRRRRCRFGGCVVTLWAALEWWHWKLCRCRFQRYEKRLTYSCKSAFLMHGVRDSNPRPSVLETDILPTKLTPCVECHSQTPREQTALPKSSSTGNRTRI